MSELGTDLEGLDNPVKRLHRILEKARSKGESIAMKYVWADALDVDREDAGSLHLALADLIKLFETARRSVEQLQDVNRDHYLKPFDKIRTVITDLNLDQRWDRLKNHLDDITMLTLQLASNTVSVEAGKAAISEENLKELQTETESLLEKVLNTDFSSGELKLILIEHLESIRRAILAYRVSGLEGLRRAVEGALGALFLHREQIEDVAKRDKKKWRILRDFVNLLGSIAQVASLGIQVTQLEGVFFPLLGPGGS